MKNTQDGEEQKEKNSKKRVIIYIIILIIIILALLTSCGCTSKLVGKIGNLFANESVCPITNDTGDIETIKDIDLTFDTDFYEMSLSDLNGKISFSYRNINPSKFTCTTSDGEVATCYVSGDYVVIKPSRVGDIEISLQTITNGKIYEATTKVRISEANRYIELSSNEGTINLYNTKTKNISYKLIGLSGEVIATSSDKDVASVTIEGSKIKINAYKTGDAVITLSLNYNGRTYTALYNLKVINERPSSSNPDYIKSGDNKLKNIEVIGGVLKPNFNANRSNYEVNVGSDIDNITLKAIPNSDKAKITINGEAITTLKNLKLNYGDNPVVIKVTAENGTVKTYTVNVKRKKPTNPPDVTNDLKNIEVSAGELEPSFNNKITNYVVRVSSNITTTNIKAIPNIEGANIIINGERVDSINNLKLNYGDNVVSVSITNSDGSIKTYYVNIIRANSYKVEFDKDLYTMPLRSENGSYELNYKVYKNGSLTNDYNLNDLKFELNSPWQNLLEIIKSEKGVLTVKPKAYEISKLDNKKGDITVKFQNEEIGKTNYEFVIPNYKLESGTKYNMSVTNIGDNLKGEKNIILNTDVLVGEIIVKEINAKSLNICMKNGNACIKVSSDSDIIESLSYTKNEVGPSALPIEVIANNVGSAKLTVEGTLFGVTFKKYDIEIKVDRKYVVKVDANGGVFNDATKELNFRVSSDEIIDLALEDKPYKLDQNDNCKYYPFLGYSEFKEGPVMYQDDAVLKNINRDMTLYAIYALDMVDITPDMNQENKTLWLSDVPLFYNENDYEKYGDETVIYPGDKGYYTMNFKNESDNTISIKSLTLKEVKTMCVDDGCINMGYIVMHRPLNKDNAVYSYGNDKDYKVLNQDIDPNSINYRGKEIILNEPIVLKPQEEANISLFWKWVEENDKESNDVGSDDVDTAIGNLAADKRNNNSINDLYELAVGINFTTDKKDCSLVSGTP